MRIISLLPVFAAILFATGCQTKQTHAPITIIETIELPASRTVKPAWIGFGNGKVKEKTFFEKVLELKPPKPRTGSVNTTLYHRQGEPLPTIRVYRGDGQWTEGNEFLGEYRLTEWPDDAKSSLEIRVGFQVSAESKVLMWIQEEENSRSVGVAQVKGENEEERVL